MMIVDWALGAQSAIGNPQSAIRNLNRQSAIEKIGNRQSAIRNRLWLPSLRSSARVNHPALR